SASRLRAKPSGGLYAVFPLLYRFLLSLSRAIFEKLRKSIFMTASPPPASPFLRSFQGGSEE
ncbi:hypothetical protein, partial [Ruminococcus callidus]